MAGGMNIHGGGVDKDGTDGSAEENPVPTANRGEGHSADVVV